MRAHLIMLLLASIALAAIPAQAQIAFRAASDSTAPGVTPLFRTAASAATSGPTLAINNTTSNGTNMVLVASIAVTPSSVAITPPSGWTLVRRLDNPGPTSNSLAVYYRVKIAADGEPASYVWGVSGATFAVGGIQVFSNVDTTNPIDAENGQSTPSSLTHAAPGVTTSTANAMLVASHAYASSRSWQPPSGMTETFDRPSGANSDIGLTIEGTRMLQAVAGASGAKTATAAQYPDAGNAHLLALRPAPGELSISHPAGTVSWDVMIAAIAFNNATAAITPPEGWTLVRRIDNTAATSNSLAIYRRIANAGNPLFYVWGIAGGAFLVGGIQSFSGVDPMNPIDAESGQSTPSATAHDTPSITTSKANAMLVTAHSYASAQSWTPQAGLTESFDRPSGLASATGQSITGTRQSQAAIGPSGAKRSTAATSADVGNTHILALRALTNVSPTVSLTSPAEGATFNAPANITLTATAADADGTIQKVEFFHDFILIATDTSAPYSVVWSGVPEGIYSLEARATDNENATASSFVNVTVNRAPALHFIHADHLNTPRLVTNDQQQAVWRWDQQEPFGVNVPDENPSGLGTFDLPLRLPGQYFDKETNLHYNYFRDYDPSIGRYGESDPIGLRGGLNTYAYGLSSPLVQIDPEGLDVTLYCRAAGGTFGRYSHCFVHVTCPPQGIDEVLSLFGKPPYGIGGLPSVSFKASASPMEGGPLEDDPNAPGQYSAVIAPQRANCDCDYEKSVISRFYRAPATQSYGGTRWNSNTFAQMLITSSAFGTSWPAGAPANAVGTIPGWRLP